PPSEGRRRRKRGRTAAPPGRPRPPAVPRRSGGERAAPDPSLHRRPYRGAHLPRRPGAPSRRQPVSLRTAVPPQHRREPYGVPPPGSNRTIQEHSSEPRNDNRRGGGHAGFFGPEPFHAHIRTAR